MKTSYYLLLVGLMTLAVVGGLAGFMKVPALSSPGSQQPTLGFQPDASDRWDKTVAEEPPLAPGAAIRIATDFMRTIRLPDHTRGWTLERIALQRMSFSGGPEEWVYVADFRAEPMEQPEWRGPPARFQVPVRFQGGVPETFNAGIPEERRFVFWRELLSSP